MHYHRAFAWCLLILPSLAEKLVVVRRQGVSIESSVSSTQSPIVTSSSVLSTPLPSSTDQPNVSSTTMIDIHTEISSPQPSAQSAQSTALNGTVNASSLPIKPTVTPSIGITGVVLMITGAAYSVVGIKNQWLQVFLSAAFLSSLSVTVLIEYVMSPPVSNAVQGAYFVAAFLTGIIFGALSLIFKELTEGLGCLLGGFCVSMWLLSLKQGGLLASSETRGGFIGAFCVGFYALSFSNYTKPYGLIVSSAFAGSTIMVLGIDCFSRAGWKEFWLYIWGLNDNLFPYTTSTYPVTRGIRVELAVTVVVCLFGLLSQFKLWTLLQERRKKQEEAEIELGRALEDRKQNDLVQWEAMYGSKSDANAANVSVPESQVQSKPVELVEAPDNPARKTEDPPSSKSNLEHHQDIEENQEKGDIEQPEGIQIEADLIEIEVPAKAEDTNADIDVEHNKTSVVAPPTPPLTPLPFKIPYSEEITSTADVDDDDAQSIQVIVDEKDVACFETPERTSVVSLFRRLSRSTSTAKRKVPVRRGSDELLVLIHPSSSTYSDNENEENDTISDFEDTRNMEIADLNLPESQTLENESDRDTLREASEMTLIIPSAAKLEENTTCDDDRPRIDRTGKLEEHEQEGMSLPADVTSTENMKMDSGSNKVTDVRRHTIDGAMNMYARKIFPFPIKDRGLPKIATTTNAKSSGRSRRKEDLTSNVVEKIPSHVSPVVISFRTNEWAKHLSQAEAPDPEPLDNHTTDIEPNLSPENSEVAAPLNVDDLKKTALTASPPPWSEDCAPPRPQPVEYSTVQRPISSLSGGTVQFEACASVSEYQTGARTPPASTISAVPTLLSTHKLPTAGHLPSSRSIHGRLRNTSCPLLNTDFEVQNASQGALRDSVYKQGAGEGALSLMAQREQRIQARLASMSLTQDSRTLRNASRQHLGDLYQSRSASQLLRVEEDDMPLAHRRALLQQNASLPMSPTMGVGFDARNLSIEKQTPIGARLMREPSKPNVSSMAAWRRSLQDDFSKQKPLSDVALAQAELMEQQRRAQMARYQRIQASENLHNSIAERMRRGDMQDLHRDAMRRMQATANRKARSP